MFRSIELVAAMLVGTVALVAILALRIGAVIASLIVGFYFLSAVVLGGASHAAHHPSPPKQAGIKH